jgi:hypothetical protein
MDTPLKQVNRQSMPGSSSGSGSGSGGGTSLQGL